MDHHQGGIFGIERDQSLEALRAEGFIVPTQMVVEIYAMGLEVFSTMKSVRGTVRRYCDAARDPLKHAQPATVLQASHTSCAAILPSPVGSLPSFMGNPPPARSPWKLHDETEWNRGEPAVATTPGMALLRQCNLTYPHGSIPDPTLNRRVALQTVRGDAS